jgi:tripartite-type tricarboxylate transporter receptor subunit TctC
VRPGRVIAGPALPTFLRLAAGACLLCVFQPQAFAQEAFPSRTVRIVVPWPPGGPPDLVARLAAQKLGESWGKPVIVENRAGATGTIGTDAVVKAAPDGHTLLLTSSQPIVIAPALFKTPYDPAKDLLPLAVFGDSSNVLVVSPSSGIHSLADLIAAARAKPGALTFSSSGLGSIGHLCGEQTKQIAGIDMLHVPYPGTAQATSAVLSGEVSLNCASIQQSAPQIKAGKLKALGTSGTRASQFLPELQTLAAQGLDGLAVNAWYGVFAPPRTPASVAQVLRDALQKVFQDPGVRQKLEGAGIERLWEEGDQAADRIESELARYRKLVQAAHITSN